MFPVCFSLCHFCFIEHENKDISTEFGSREENATKNFAMSNSDKHNDSLVFYFLIRLFISDVCERLNDVEISVLLLFLYTHIDICTFFRELYCLLY